MVVEEGPEKHKSKEKRHHPKVAHAMENGIDKLEEEDEVSDEEESSEEEEEEEEEEKYDIDDLSSTESPKGSEVSHEDAKATLEENKQSAQEAIVGKEKMLEEERNKFRGQPQAEELARALKHTSLHQGKLRTKPRSARSRSRSGVRSGVETPDRFAGPHPHPPKLSSRHVQFRASESSPTSAVNSHPMERDQTITRDTVLSPETVMKTPTMQEGHRAHNPRKGRSRERGGRGLSFEGEHTRRAFAVWGQDESESESAASDSDR